MKDKKWLFGIILLIITLPYLFYMIKFWEGNLSNDTSTWGDFGAYINGTIMPIIAIVGFVITYAISKASEDQINDNVERQNKAKQPLLYISYFDSTDRISIKLTNKGLGPALIKDYKILDSDMKEEYDSIFKVLLSLGEKTYTKYTGDLSTLILSPRESISLFMLKKSEDYKDPEFIDLCAEIRNCFKDLVFKIKYEDVYNNEMPVYIRNLKWFGRQ